MGTTTLITFLLKTARTVKSVELLGSWDNFSKAYPMERDARCGRGSWRGCHRFSDIICDGDTVRPLGDTREGGLLEGGRYWYYYRLDDDIEIHDRAHPSTTSCPFLPGQQVNLLEMPIQGKHFGRDYHNRSPSSDTSGALTLNPADKFLALQPPSPEARRNLSHIHERPVTRSRSRPQTAIGVDDAPYFWQGASWLQDDSRPATPLGAASIYSEPPIPVTEWHVSVPNRPLSTGRFGFGDYPRLSFNDSLVDLGGGHSWLDLPEAEHMDPAEWMNAPLVGGGLKATTSMRSSNPMVLDQPDPLRTHAIEGIMDHDLDEQSHLRRMASDASHRTSRQLSKRASSIMTEDFRVQTRPHSIVKSETCSTHTSLLRAASDATSPQRSGTSLTRSGSFACSLQHTTSVSSARTSGMFSSLTSGSGPPDITRHSRLSQPLTPTISETGDLVVDTLLEQQQLQLDSTPVRKFDSGFLGYSLPEAEMSALTIRNLETANSCSSPDMTTYKASHRQQYVEAWNDGHEDRSTAFQELVDDLGYLGSMIA